jgi:hypothetical protein
MPSPPISVREKFATFSEAKFERSSSGIARCRPSARSLALLILLSGCLPFPHTRAYRPVSTLERQAFDRASQDVFPDDVRNAPADHSGTILVWPGVILSSEFVDHGDRVEIQLLLEHHYYDWIEDFGAQRERIFLSPRGEGRLRTSWIVRKGGDTEALRKAARPGTLLILYGRPDQVADDGSISVRAVYIRAIDPEWFRTDVMEYGRPGQPVRLLKVPGRDRR